MIADADRAVLRDVARIAGQAGCAFFVIGAGARLLAYDWPNRVAGGRGTTDWDIAVRMATWGEYERLRLALTADDAPFRPSEAEHRLFHVQGRSLDVVPFGGVEVGDRTVVYPRAGTTHSVLGLRELEDCCVSVDVGDGVRVNVLGPAGLVLLKALSYLERRPALTHDVQDIDFIVRTYGVVLGDEAVFARAAEVLQAERVAYVDVGAYLLGRDIQASGPSRVILAPLRTLLLELADPMSRAVDDVLAASTWGSVLEREGVVLRYAALHLGLES